MANETRVKASIFQIEEATKYKGSIAFNDYSFQYEIVFGIPVPELNKAVERNPEGIMSRMHLKVRDSTGANMPLENQAKALFMGVIGPMAIELHRDNPQANGNGDYWCESYLALRNYPGSPYYVPGMTITFGLEKEYAWPEIPNLEEILGI